MAPYLGLKPQAKSTKPARAGWTTGTMLMNGHMIRVMCC